MQEPATSLNPELMGSIAAIGIVKGKPFAPDARMKKILTEALTVANAASRTIFMNPRDPSWFYYPDSAWMNFLFVTGYEFETPIPMITREGVKPFPPTGYRQLDARTSFFYGITGITPAMAMRLPGIGSQYLFAMMDANKNYFDGAKTYKVTLPPNIPAAKFWSFTLYDNQSRSMLASIPVWNGTLSAICQRSTDWCPRFIMVMVCAWENRWNEPSWMREPCVSAP